MIVRLGRNRPVIASREFDIDVVTEDDGIQHTFIETKISADDYLNVCSDERLFDLLEVLEVSASGARCVDERINALTKHKRYFRSQFIATTCLAVNLV